jgi:hypothetical protein
MGLFLSYLVQVKKNEYNTYLGQTTNACGLTLSFREFWQFVTVAYYGRHSVIRENVVEPDWPRNVGNHPDLD